MQHVGTENESAGADVTFYRQHASRIFAYIYHQVPSRQDAEDILMEVFIAALKYDNLPGRSQEQQVAWLQQVARHKVIDRYRRTLPQTSLPLEQAMNVIDRNLTPEQSTIQREAVMQLHHALTQLSLLEQQVVHLRFGNGLRFAQIAEILNKPEGSVRALLSRTLRRLRNVYPEVEERE